MKTDLFWTALLCLVAGCRASTREVTTPAGPPGPGSPQESAAPQFQPLPQQTPRRVVYFMGSFNKVGCYAWTNGMTLKDGIQVAAGFEKWANGTLQLIHRDGSREFYRLGRGGTLTNNPALQPEDVILSRGQRDGF